jgi:hypothetical protein
MKMTRTITSACVLVLLLWLLVGQPSRAQREPLRIYDLGAVCLYAIDTGGAWGSPKTDLGVQPTARCPAALRQ